MADIGQNGFEIGSVFGEAHPGDVYLVPPPPPNMYIYKLFVGAPGTPQRRVLRLGSRFLSKSLHRVGGYPMYIG